jgi:hypothetical protein
MKKLFIITLLSLCANIHSQTKILSGYDFDDGKYVLYSIGSGGLIKSKGILDSIGNWYINDNEIIKQVLDVWVLKEKANFDLYNNNYDYYIELYRNKLKVETFLVNIDNRTLYHKNKAYEFGPEYLRIIYRKTKPAINHETRNYDPYDSLGIFHVSEYDSAMAYYYNCVKDTSVMFISHTTIDEGAFEGYFCFQYLLKKSDYKCGLGEILIRLKKKISAKYQVNFKLDFEYLEKEQIYVWVWCNKELFDRFSLYSKVDYYEDGEVWHKSFFSVSTFPSNQKNRYSQIEIDEIMNKIK